MGPLVSPGIVCYAEKEEKPFWFTGSSLGQMIHFDTIKFDTIKIFHIMKRPPTKWGRRLKGVETRNDCYEQTNLERSSLRSVEEQCPSGRPRFFS